MISKKQFDILTFLEGTQKKHTQRNIAKETGMSVGTANKTLSQLYELGYVDQTSITEKGLGALEPYRVKRAVILAAGFGSRLVPITLNTPKPLIRVRGNRIIDSLLDAITEAGINEIVIVRGYLSEQFDQLLYKYPNIKFIENPAYNEANNISSAMCVRYLLRNAYVCEADLLVCNKKLITKYQYSSNYIGVPVDKTDDWCFYCDNKRIIKISIGGENCYHMFGISYWNDTDGAKLAEHIKQVYESPGGKERYWDQVALEYYISEYSVYARECTFDDVTEIDTYRELKALDSTYI